MESLQSITENTLINTSRSIGNHTRTSAFRRSKIFDYLMYGALVLCVIGSAGNIIIIKIMRRRRFREMPRSLICLTLAIVDLIFLIFYFVEETSAANGVYLYEVYQNTSCRLYLFISPLPPFLMHLDSWLIVTMSCERLVGIIKPLHVHTIVTRPRVKVVISSIIIFFFIFDWEESFRYDYMGVKPCSLDDKVFTGIFFIKFQISLLLLSVVPLSIIIPTNIIIVVSLVRHQQAQRTMRNASRTNETRKVTLMLTSVSVAFIIFVSPLAIHFLAGGHSGTTLHGIVAFLAFVNIVVNFFLYFFSGDIFRQEVFKWMTSLCKRRSYDERNDLSIITKDTNIH